MRDQKVTIAKGLTILLMVLLHSGSPVGICHYFGMSHMPLFFFMSGYCFKVSYLTRPWDFVRKKVTGVYGQFVKWALFFLLIHSLLYKVGFYPEYARGIFYSSKRYLLEQLYSILVCMQTDEWLLGGYWFLKSLFWGNMLFYGIRWCLRGKAVWAMLVMLTVGLAFSYLNVTVPYLTITTKDVLAGFYIAFGHWYRQQEYGWHKRWWVLLGVAVLTYVASVCCYASMNRVSFPTTIPFIAVSCMGCIGLFSLAYFFDRYVSGWLKRLMVYTGDHTFGILTWHFTCFKLMSMAIIGCAGLEYARLAEATILIDYAVRGWYWAYFAVGTALPLAGAWLWERYVKR